MIIVNIKPFRKLIIFSFSCKLRMASRGQYLVHFCFSIGRFREELAVFDEMEISDSTLEVLEPYLKKPHFSGDYLERKTTNAAVGSLLLWVKGVFR